MPFSTVNLKSGQSVRVEHSEDATKEEIIQLAREEAAAQAATPRSEGSLARTGVGIAGEIAVGEGAKLGGAAAGAAIGAAGGPLGMAVGGGIGYLVGAISGGLGGSYQDCFSCEYSRDVVTEYMKRYAKPSRFDRPITLKDLSFMHVGGPNAPWSTGQKLQNCEVHWNKVKNTMVQIRMDRLRDAFGSR